MGENMNNSIPLNSVTYSDESMEIVGVYLAWLKAVDMFCMIDDAGLYQDPPNHRIVKICQD